MNSGLPSQASVDTSADMEFSVLSIEDQEKLLNLQQTILESVARGADHLEVINQICQLGEGLLPNSVGSVMLMDDKYEFLNVYAAPSVPSEGIVQLNGLRPGPGGGSCGNVIYRQQAQFVSNTFEDERWKDLRQLAYNFNLCSCWSVPIYSGEHKVIGSFALSSFEHRSPTPFHKKLLEIGSSIIGIVLERNKSQESIRQLEKVFEGSEEGIMITDSSSAILTVNPSFTKLLGYTLDDLKGKTPQVLASGQHNPSFYSSMWQSIKQFGHWRGEIWNRRKNGEVFPEWLSISEVTDTDGVVTHYIGMFSDISHIKSAEEEIQYLSSHDVLTGLPNLTLFKDRLETAISLAAKTNNKIGFLAIDLDNFKFFNESLGHAAGDKILRLVADKLKQCLPGTDTISRHESDEFIILLNNMPDHESLSNVVETLLKEVAACFVYESRPIATSCSIGVAVYPNDGDNFDTLFSRAHKALSKAKDDGRNTARFFTEELNTNNQHYLNTSHGLREALAQNHFELHYQPQINVTSGEVIGAEALIRWKHPQNGMIPPAQFIPVAEQTSLIVEIGEWVINEACRQAVAWQKSGLPPFIVAVNVSAVQFRRGNLENIITRALNETGLNPNLLEIELTESILLQDMAGMLVLLDKLKQLGVKLAIDDFGTGYSSLAYLKKFNIDRLKIDQSFVRDINNDSNDAAIVRAIVQMAHTLNLQAIAEGVEDEMMLSHLRECGCDEVQGYFYSKPLTAEDFFTYMQNK